MKGLATLSCIFALVTYVAAQGYKPRSGFVPDSATAIQIAEAVLVPVYGKKKIEAEKPFTAQLKDNIWTISGTLRCPDGKGGFTPESDCDGGTAVVQISKKDAHIISMTHYQ